MNAIFNKEEMYINTPDGTYINTKVFTLSEESDYDRSVYELVLITKLNKEEVNRIEEDFGYKTYRCGHEWDCCGCVSSEYINIEEVSEGVFKIKYTINYNY